MTRLAQDLESTLAPNVDSFSPADRVHTKLENPLHLYVVEDTDAFVAESPDEALAIMQDFFQMEPGYTDGMSVCQMDDDKMLTISVEKDEIVGEDENPFEKVTKPVREWVKENGKGFIWSTEY